MSRHAGVRTLLLAFIAATVAGAPLALADPPPHAPAHGWRAKHDPYYVGYTGRHWSDDYGIRSGRCDRARVGTVLGAVVGGAIGSTIGSGDSRLIAILAGATIGALLGREIGRDMDRSDHACVAHALELAADGSRVSWPGARAGVVYHLVPGSRFERGDQVCRRFTLVREQGGKRVSKRGGACRVGDGEWRSIEG